MIANLIIINLMMTPYTNTVISLINLSTKVSGEVTYPLKGISWNALIIAEMVLQRDDIIACASQHLGGEDRAHFFNHFI
ncbi:MAG: hypothetical protein U5N56_08120 [Candidatus Marinimicrobia bacterium]|nr:hypothetical protein [Candidatus Neomarinimicrobiota bacterium]